MNSHWKWTSMPFATIRLTHIHAQSKIHKSHLLYFTITWYQPLWWFANTHHTHTQTSFRATLQCPAQAWLKLTGSRCYTREACVNQPQSPVMLKLPPLDKQPPRKEGTYTNPATHDHILKVTSQFKKVPMWHKAILLKQAESSTGLKQS